LDSLRVDGNNGDEDDEDEKDDDNADDDDNKGEISWEITGEILATNGSDVVAIAMLLAFAFALEVRLEAAAKFCRPASDEEFTVSAEDVLILATKGRKGCEESDR
jgi:hypothetical protein